MEPHADLWSCMQYRKPSGGGAIAAFHHRDSRPPFSEGKSWRLQKRQNTVLPDYVRCGAVLHAGFRILHIVYQCSRTHRMKKPLLSAPKQGRVNCQHTTQPPTRVPAGKVGYRVNVNRSFLVFHWLRWAYTRKQISNQSEVLAVSFVWPVLKTPPNFFLLFFFKKKKKKKNAAQRDCMWRACTCVF